jgi:hypothetical protein
MRSVDFCCKSLLAPSSKTSYQKVDEDEDGDEDDKGTINGISTPIESLEELASTNEVIIGVVGTGVGTSVDPEVGAGVGAGVGTEVGAGVGGGGGVGERAATKSEMVMFSSRIETQSHLPGLQVQFGAKEQFK